MRRIALVSRRGPGPQRIGSLHLKVHAVRLQPRHAVVLRGLSCEGAHRAGQYSLSTVRRHVCCASCNTPEAPASLATPPFTSEKKMSERVTMPMQRPASSTTGTRRICKRWVAAGRPALAHARTPAAAAACLRLPARAACADHPPLPSPPPPARSTQNAPCCQSWRARRRWACRPHAARWAWPSSRPAGSPHSGKAVSSAAGGASGRWGRVERARTFTRRPPLATSFLLSTPTSWTGVRQAAAEEAWAPV